MYDVTITEHDPDDFTPRTRQAVRLGCVAVLASIATAAVLAVVNPAPWSPLGQVQEPAPAVVEAPTEVRGA
jgi:hypothetical protein